MDNLTHSLFGLAVGEAALQFHHRGDPKLASRSRADYWFASVVGNNFPDLDFILTGLTDGRLGYLLHHRGYTHTLLAALPQAILVYFALGLYRRLRGKWPRPAEAGAVCALAFFGVWCHIGLDALNSYGVHPFWPLSGRWFYGDVLFIVEPTVWFCFLPFLMLASPMGKRQFAFLSGLALAAVWFLPFVPKVLAGLASAEFVVVSLISLRLSPAKRTVCAFASFAVVLAGFGLAGEYARRQVWRSGDLQQNGFALRDVVLSPLPANPVCWSVITVETSAADQYRLAKGVFSASPRWFPPEKCPKLRSERWGPPTRELSEIRSGDRHFWWQGESVSSLSQMQSLKASDCQFAALLRFARVPFVQDEGEGFVVGDFRFDYSKDLGFAKLSLRQPAESCPQNVPSWDLPRGDLFNPRSAP